MSYITIVGMILGAWVMLSLFGAERQRELEKLHRRVEKEAEETAKQRARMPQLPPPAEAKEMPAPSRPPPPKPPATPPSKAPPPAQKARS
jgi:hypothetical protein